jgi:hypothetical protein
MPRTTMHICTRIDRWDTRWGGMRCETVFCASGMRDGLSTCGIGLVQASGFRSGCGICIGLVVEERTRPDNISKVGNGRSIVVVWGRVGVG